MIQTAVADVVGPAVAAVHPHGLLGHIFAALEDLGHHSLLLSAELGALQHGQQLVGSHGGGIQVVIGLQPLGDGGLHGGILGHAVQLLNELRHSSTQLLHSQAHTIGELGVVFKQGVGPCHALAFLILAVRHAGHSGTPGLGAAGGVGQVHLVAVELGQELDVGRLAAAGAGPVELHQGLAQLAALECELVDAVVLFRQSLQILPACLIQGNLVGGNHLQRLAALGAGGNAAAAAGAIQGGYTHGVLEAVHLGTLGVHQIHPCGGISSFLLIQQIGADYRMGTHKGAHVALDALAGIPHRQVRGDAALFILGGAQGHGAILHALKGGNRQQVALLGVNGHQDVLDNVGHIGGGGLDSSAGEILPALLHLHLLHGVDAGVHGGDVHVHNLLALESVGLFHGILHVLHGVLHGDNIGQLEEGCLQHHVGAVAQAQRLGLLVGVDDIEFYVVLGNVLQDVTGHLLLQLILAPLAVEQEAAMGLQLGDDVVLGQIRLVVAGYEICVAHIIGRADGLLAEAQVALGDAEGLLGVILKIRLAVHISGLADDLDGVLIGTHGTVRAQAPELAGNGALRLAVQCRAQGQGQVGHIVHNADGEVVLGLIQQEIVIHGFNLSRGSVLAGQAVAAGKNLGPVLVVDVSSADILI